MLLRYLHRFDRWWKVCSRGHPIPDPVEIVLEVCFELLDGHPVPPAAPLLRLTCLYASHTSCFGMTNGLSIGPDLPTRLLPGDALPVARANKPRMSRPLRSTPITEASPLLRAGPPASAATVLNASQFPLPGALPVTTPVRVDVSALAFPRSMQKPQTRLAPPPCRTPSGQSTGTRQTLPEVASKTPVLMPPKTFTTRQQRFAFARLPDPYLTHLVRLFLIAHHDSLQLTQHEAV